MGEIRSWLGELAVKKQIEAAKIVEDNPDPEKEETLDYLRASLVKQHESLGVIVSYLAKNYPDAADFDSVLEALKGMDKFDNLLRKWNIFGWLYLLIIVNSALLSCIVGLHITFWWASWRQHK